MSLPCGHGVSNSPSGCGPEGVGESPTGHPILMSHECPFCGKLHESEFYDEIEEAVMACRDRAPTGTHGSLEDWLRVHPFGDTEPIRVEIAAYGGNGGW